MLEDFWRFFEEFWRNWFVVRRLRTSIILRPTKKMRFWGQYGLQTASEVKSKIRFEIHGPNYIYYHVRLDCFGLLWHLVRKKERTNLPLLDLSASPQVKTAKWKVRVTPDVRCSPEVYVGHIWRPIARVTSRNGTFLKLAHLTHQTSDSDDLGYGNYCLLELTPSE